jgi:hypothetical protein
MLFELGLYIMGKNIIINAVIILSERLYHAYCMKLTDSIEIAVGLSPINTPTGIDKTLALIKNSDLIRVLILALNSIP